ncbi:MAG: hypothetical protein MUE46_02445 [Xanthomonadales bacterium]|jgi:hypothetical protein|nr:hypothetical protein [Xanthomonadales bacterium]
MNRLPLPPPLTRKADRHLSAIESFLDQPLLFLLAWIQRKRGPRGGRLGLLLRSVRIAALVLKLAVLGGLLGDHLSDMSEWMAATPECATPTVTIRVLVGL